MPGNKDRLYIALYARGGQATMPGGEDRYHWALIVGPKVERNQSEGYRIHAKERVYIENGVSRTRWIYEELRTTMLPTSSILARVVVAKITDLTRLMAIFQRIPLRGTTPGWNCVYWVREALETALADGRCLGTSLSGWQRSRELSMWYIGFKIQQHRYDGRANFDQSRVATYDALEGREVSP